MARLKRWLNRPVPFWAVLAAAIYFDVVPDTVHGLVGAAWLLGLTGYGLALLVLRAWAWFWRTG